MFFVDFKSDKYKVLDDVVKKIRAKKYKYVSLKMKGNVLVMKRVKKEG